MRFINSIGAAAAAVAVVASPIERAENNIVLPLKHVSTVKSIKGIVDRGLARIQKFNGVKTLESNDASSGPVTNEDESYVAPVSIGGKIYELIVDTGSSNTWTGARSEYSPGSTGNATGGTVSVGYGSGRFSGLEYTDTVSFGGLTVNSQSFGAATSSSGFSGVDGIIGFGPVDLTEGTVSNANTVPTFLNNLYQQGSISTEVLGVSFRPESGGDSDDTNGELTLGGTDSSKYTGSITYVPTAKTGAVAPYWGISIAGFTYGSTTLASSGSGIVDTGTTLIYVPTNVYNEFLSAAGGETDSSSRLASFSSKPTGNFGIKIGSTTFTLTPSQYLIPTAQYSFYGLSPGKYYSWIFNGGSSGVDTIIGQKFLENYYSVFDTTNARIGFAAAV